MSGRLRGKRVLVTHADRYLGPPVVELFRAEGAEVVADETDPTTGPGVAGEVVRAAGEIDVLVANFAGPRRSMPVTEMLREVGDYTGNGAEAAELALALATGASGFLAGQIIPISGGWAT